ncbi:hypothetical protein GIB67_005748 [Kingdonia uniflora]|uniref:Histone H2B n=1 Tax=Kingdonia uniflora TaxID=39325 RepID=A0A7J7KVG9_9MAGN|nr:hypothetical protein GIB67_005748 [Kingdonia uniflora]
MAPKRRAVKVVGSVVRTAKKVVEETMNLVVVEDNIQQEEIPFKAHVVTTKEPMNIVIKEKTTDTQKSPMKPQVVSSTKVPVKTVIIEKPPSKSKLTDVSKKPQEKPKAQSQNQKKNEKSHGKAQPKNREKKKGRKKRNQSGEGLAGEAAKLSSYTGRKTLSAREIQGAVKLVLPGELEKHAIVEGTKAVTTYMGHNSGPNG